MNKLLSYLHIGQLGLLELLLAFYCIISGYTIAGVPMNVAVLVVMDIIALYRTNCKILHNKLLYFVFGFVLCHELVVWVLEDLSQTQLNNIVSRSIFLGSILILPPALRYDRLVNSLYLVGYISCIGIIYHFMQLLSGHLISPIPLPFLPTPDIGSRLFEESFRPCSFYWEPAAFVTYMMVPMFLSLVRREWTIMVFFMFCIFLSTSTNGNILSVALVLTYIFMTKMKLRYKIMPVIVILGMIAFLFNSSMFEAGVDKMENTEASSNIRLSNGIYLLEKMPVEHIIWGTPVHTAAGYIQKGYVHGLQLRYDGSYFVSDFWRVMIIYGIFGLIFHLLVFYRFLRIDKSIWPYIFVLFFAQFSQSIAFSSTYTFQICFVLCYLTHQKRKNESTYNNNLIRQ